MDELSVSLWLGGVCLAAAVVCGWMGARPWDIRKGPRLMPWRFLMMILAAVGVVAIAHARGVAGLTIGPR